MLYYCKTEPKCYLGPLTSTLEFGKNIKVTSVWFFFLWQLGHGDFSAANTRVLRMVNTLGVENEAKQTIEALQAELQKAKERLQAVEELKGQTGKFLIVDLSYF